jgi:uncharacterized membrane protein YedE/YeeE
MVNFTPVSALIGGAMIGTAVAMMLLLNGRIGGAVAVSGAAFAISRHLKAPLFALSFGIPSRRDIDARLVGGAALFGVGWGLAGYCPGPAVSSKALGRWEPLVFLAAMLAGMFVYRLIPQPPRRTIQADA